MRGLSRNPALPDSLVLRILEHPAADIVGVMYGREWSDELFDIVAAHPDVRLREMLARSAQVTAEQRVRMVDDPAFNVVLALLEGPFTTRPQPLPLWAYRKLAEHPKMKRMLRLLHPKELSPAAVAAFADVEDKEIAAWARARPEPEPEPMTDERARTIPALDQDADLRDHAEICEITDLIDTSAHPDGTRVIVRRELPHPGAQLSLFDHIVGWRHQLVITDTPYGHGLIQYLEARHRAHARVEDRIRCGKNTGLGHFPSREFAINAAWLELALAAIDLLAWTKTLLLQPDLATAEPKKLRYRLLHVAARITRSGRQTRLRIAENWPWATDLADAFTRLAALPRPIT